MNLLSILHRELQGSVEFFLDFTNLDPQSSGFGLTVDSTKDMHMASIAATGFALTAWVIAAERGFLPRERALAISRGTLRTLLHNVSHHRGFFAHFLDMKNAQRWGKCEYSTIDSALCLNGVITAAAYFQDDELSEMAQALLARVDWPFIIFERDGPGVAGAGAVSSSSPFIIFEREGQTLFRMAYNPDQGGDYVSGQPGFISQWDMAAEQKMMYLQAAAHIEPGLARALYAGFRRDKGHFDGHAIIINPGWPLT
jgi:hypothetical protein